VNGGVVPVGEGQEPGAAGRCPLRAGHRRGKGVRRVPGDDRQDVPEPREQAKAIGVYSFVASAGASVGLLAGGVLTQSINWHWIFFVNIPIGIVTAILALRLLQRDRGIGFGGGADVLGAVLITGALMLLV